LSNRCVLRKLTQSVCLSISFLLSISTTSLIAQEAPATGNVQGTVLDSDGNAVANARILISSKSTLTSTVTRSGKDGVYNSDQLPPGTYMVRAEGRNFHVADLSVSVQAGASATANFTLEPIDPGPFRLEGKVPGNLADTAPINGRNYLQAARSEPGVQVVDGSILDPGKTGTQTLSINSTLGRTTHYDIDEVEAMDETRGGVIGNLPAESVRDLTVTRSTPDVFQSLNAAGSVRAVTRSGQEDWHGNVFGHFRNRAVGMAGFPSSDPGYSRQQYGFGVGGAVIQQKAFLFVSGERTKQDGQLPVYPGFPLNVLTTRDAFSRENMVTARLDYNWSENAKWFARFSYDNANEIGPTNSLSPFRNDVNIPSAVFGLDWNHGRFAHTGRFGYSKMVDSINPDFNGAFILPEAPFHQQLGSFAFGASNAGPRQTIQRDIFGRYDGSTIWRDVHTLRFGGVIHYISQNDFYNPGSFGPSLTSSNGIDVIRAINSDPNALPPLIPGDPRGPADNPLNYPVGTFTIYNGLGGFSENSSFGRSTGGHTDTRFELHFADTVKVRPNINVTVGVNYVRDSGRTNSDLGSIPCSAINTTIVTTPPCTGNDLILDQFGGITGLGKRVSQPNWNFAPEAGVAWDPGHTGKTVIRVGGGMFFDNFLLQNAYQDRVSRLSNGQYFRSLTLCPTGSTLFPNGSIVNSVDGLDIATQICGQPIGGTVINNVDAPIVVSQAIQDLQAQLLAAQAGTSGPNLYSLANSLSNFGGMLAPGYHTPRTVHINAGMQHQFGEHSVLSIDYVRQIGTQLPLGIDTNHVGDVSHLTDADNIILPFRTELAAINATLAANPASAGCPVALFAGSSSQASVNCYLAAVPGASIIDFARQGLDSSNAYCGPFPCSVLGKRDAAFGGVNPDVGSNLMFFPTGRSLYQSVQIAFRTSGNLALRGVRHADLAVSYTYSKYESNVVPTDGSGGDVSTLAVATDYNSPHVGHFGSSGLDRRNQFTLSPTFTLPRGLRLSLIAQMLSPLSLSARLPQLDGGGQPGEIFRTDATGDGTVGDLLPGTSIGGAGGYSGSSLRDAVNFYNTTYAGKLTPAGQKLVSSNLFTASQLSALGALYPALQPFPANAATEPWLKTVDLRLSWPVKVGERVSIEPTVAAFNVFNFANYGGPGRLLSGVLDGSPGSSLNNSSSAATCGDVPALCTSRLDRILAGSGTYGVGAPRQLEFGVRVTF